uniref:Uncharacterized protein n=1 Tax=Triticum urartu TaxID=4572 RepID=A0A8R7RG26_TRIUA
MKKKQATRTHERECPRARPPDFAAALALAVADACATSTEAIANPSLRRRPRARIKDRGLQSALNPCATSVRRRRSRRYVARHGQGSASRRRGAWQGREGWVRSAGQSSSGRTARWTTCTDTSTTCPSSMTRLGHQSCLGIFKVHASNINKILSFYLKLDLLLMFAFAIDDVNLSKYPTTFSLSLDSICW